MLNDVLNNKEIQEMALELYRERFIFPCTFLQSIKENNDEIEITLRCKKDEADKIYYMITAGECD